MKKPEKWLPVDGYLGRYAVSDHGNVMSMDFKNTGLPGLLRSHLNKRLGYLTITLRIAARQKTWTVHELVAAAFLGDRPSGYHVNHKDGVKTNNCIENLQYVTPSDNQRHAYGAGLMSRKGEAHNLAKLNDEKVRDIFARYARGETQKAIGKSLGVHQVAISLVLRGVNWAHVTDQVLQ